MDFPELPFLRTFVAVYEARTVTAASARLHRTQPTVSYQVQRLEEALGAPLFERRSARLVPTPLADGLFRLAGGFARDLHAVLRRDDEGRPLQIAAVSGFGRYVLFPALRGSARLMRGLTLRYPAAEEVLRRVLEGEVDVGFTYRPTVHPRLSLEPVYEEKLVLAAAPSWARRLRTPADFQGVPLVTYDESDYVVGRWLGHHFGQRHPRWHSAAHFEELEEVLDMVALGEGVSVVPDFCLPGPRPLRAVGWGKAPLRNSVYAVQRAHAPTRPAVAELLDRLRELQAAPKGRPSASTKAPRPGPSGRGAAGRRRAS